VPWCSPRVVRRFCSLTASSKVSVTSLFRAGDQVERLRVPEGRGLGGRATPKPTEQTSSLGPGDRLIMVSDGVIVDEDGTAGIGFDGLIEAALRSERGTAADTVRKIHAAVLDASAGHLDDDATAVCLSVS
jgi:serine phosphatase RsbU (regulator of sigma subunit)